VTPEAAAKLRSPFPASAVGKLPRAGITLDYIGHAAVTDRLLAVDPLWTWEPMAYDADGGPLIRVNGKEAELWIRLTVCGHTRPGVGTAPAGSFELAKQLVSDAIRNASMRFGVALDLWAKADLHPEPPPEPPPAMTTSQADELAAVLANLDDHQSADLKAWWKAQRLPRLESLTRDQADVVIARLEAVQVPEAS